MRPRKSLKSIVNLLLLKSPLDLFFFVHYPKYGSCFHDYSIYGIS